MMSKVILVVLDGLNCKSTSINMGYLNALCKENLGKFYSLECELPSMSRPYKTDDNEFILLEVKDF
ncbi:TPA_asm: hypothetical protein GD669_09830, partial [Campylobacter jejuni]|nr:hypothetical protein [Campylobacter jejuni]HAA1644700.1 hypothetical protein [Campylobacter jejuni]